MRNALLFSMALALGTASTPLLAAPAAPAAATAAKSQLHLQTFHPGPQAMFAVSSVLIEGRRDALLVDAQFAASDARALVEKIRASGKQLTTIYISHGDPDYYFGLATLQDAFPQARIVATAQTVAHIQQTQAAKLAYWGPKMGADVPARIVVPQVLESDALVLEGQRLPLIGLDGPTPDRSVLWVPSLRAIVGGIPVVAGEHVWMADTQTPQSHADWLKTLQQLQALKPSVVVPGHCAPGAALDASALRFTADYIRAFDVEAAKAKDSAALVQAMRARYPALAGVESLELSAKVAKGEMQWP
ncbi:MBL fold metallo-hydrolase [Stenotrophomonas sp. S48]|uniref:MBL fold metallo-hydrolase n=1 Tax=unclassified Stenotrophomonas TaxID=196198 RepID=UPI0018FF7FC3|nr:MULTISPECIES: MBL fold metallo-hydrolase [unclassified Stenotrophomonas]MBK0026103.1 MBL fold metallo-hydrolase [Stenotrophomonas sp. S48]MBK0048026.1 MBL fold metallo-hydrolase [Stenotrophomonas sp. S49]